ncbi:DUF3995 domain-containing protein [Streptomyces coerulescens]|uniref:DUF3995 domain-containing protein n=1 Tax=Streptomyces coerulescens TaxID=29304 RepID=A0ABW0CNN2_STRCD
MIPTLVTAVLTAGLTVIGVLHFIWAFSPWPLKDEVAFTKAVLGNASGTMPPAPLSALVGVVLLGGGAVSLMTNGSVPEVGPDWLCIAGSYGLALVLLGRGLGGYLMGANATGEFQRLNAVLYSPLCIALGLMSGAIAVYATVR